MILHKIYFLASLVSFICLFIVFNLLLFFWLLINLLVVFLLILFFFIFTLYKVIKIKKNNIFLYTYIILGVIFLFYIFNYTYLKNDITTNSNLNFELSIFNTIGSNNWLYLLGNLEKNKLNKKNHDIILKCIKENCDLWKNKSLDNIIKYYEDINSEIEFINNNNFFIENKIININNLSDYIITSNYIASWHIKNNNIIKWDAILKNNIWLGINLLNSTSWIWKKYTWLYVFENTLQNISDKNNYILDFENIMENYASYEYYQAKNYLNNNSNIINNFFFNKEQYLEYKKQKLYSIITNKDEYLVKKNIWALFISREYLYNKIWWDLISFQKFKNRLEIIVRNY